MIHYQVTARKWRPKELNQVIGQHHVTTALTNAINNGKVSHAYLFSGPRGVGKTSIARVLSKLLNCNQSPHICEECFACKEITSGQAIDVREIDGASNRGIEQIRDIRDNVLYTPLALKYKIFIIDEVHMLTKEASNALLKVLEEPPSHVIFILATTEANKILPTIKSRCQHYTLRRIPTDAIKNHLMVILNTENITYEQSALDEITHAGDGSMRDAQTILDQVILYSNGNITLSSTRELLGIPDTVYFEQILLGLKNQDIITVLEQSHSYLTAGGSGYSFAENLAKFIKQSLFIIKLSFPHPLIDLNEDKYFFLKDLLQGFSEDDLITLLNLSLELCLLLRKENAERFWIDSILFKMLDYKNRVTLTDLRQEIFKVLGRNTLPKELINSLSENSIESKKSSITAPLLQKNELKKENVLEIHERFPSTEYSRKQNIKSLGTVEDTIKNLFEIP